jgi:hypothetical protein
VCINPSLNIRDYQSGPACESAAEATRRAAGDATECTRPGVRGCPVRARPECCPVVLTLTGDMHWSYDCLQGYGNIFQWYTATSPYKKKRPVTGAFSTGSAI